MGSLKLIMKEIFQVAILFVISLAMNDFANLLHLPVPGSILGILVLFILLKTKAIKLSWIEQGANWLLAELILFFIPSAVGVMKYIPLMKSEGIRILIVVIFSTVIVMASSGIIASRIAKRKEHSVS